MEKMGFWIGVLDRDLELQWEWVIGKLWIKKLKIKEL